MPLDPCGVKAEMKASWHPPSGEAWTSAEELGVISIAFQAISPLFLGFPWILLQNFSWMNYTIMCLTKRQPSEIDQDVLFDDRSLSQFTSTFDLAFGQKAAE